MAKLNFTKYPEINNIAREIDTLQAKLKKVKKVIKEIDLRKLNFKIILKNSEAKIRSDFALQKRDFKIKFENDLKRAKYFTTDVKKLKANFESKMFELGDASNFQIQQRRQRQRDDIEKLDQSYDICKNEEKKILSTISELKAKLKERLDSEKPKIVERKREFNRKIKEAISKYRNAKLVAKKDYKNLRNNLIRIFKRSHPYYKNLRFKIATFNLKKIDKLDENIYDLVVKTNELKLAKKRTPLIEKNNVSNLRNEKRLNECKGEKVTFDIVKNRFLESSNRITNWRYITVLKNSFFSIVPVIFIAAIFSLFNSFIFGEEESLMNLIFGSSHEKVSAIFRFFGEIIKNGINQSVGIILVVIISWHMSRYYSHVDAFFIVFASVIAFVVMQPKIAYVISGHEAKLNTIDKLINSNNESGGSWIKTFGKNQSLFAVVVGLSCPPLYSRLAIVQKLKIRMPNDAPTIIVKTFNAFIPITITILVFTTISFTIFEIGSIPKININIHDKDGVVQSKTLQIYDLQDILTVTSVKILSTSKISTGNMVTMLLLEQFMWFFGIDPEPFIKSVINPILNKTGSTGVFTMQSVSACLQQGGGVAFLGAVISIILFSKRRDHRLIALISILPVIFNISEPFAYGLPITFNPIFILSSLIVSFLLPPIMYALSVWMQLDWSNNLDFLEKLSTSGSVNLSSASNGLDNVPFFISAGLGAGSKWYNGEIVAFTCLFISCGLYTPSVILSGLIEKQDFVDRIIKDKERDKAFQPKKIVIE